MDKLKQERQEKIVDILSLLHQGGSFEEAKALFNQTFEGVDVTEIAAAEKALIQTGLNPTEIQELCTIHVAVFKGSINEIHHSNYEHEQPGHPIHTMKLENQVLQSLLTDEIDGLLEKISHQDWSIRGRLKTALDDLWQLDKHYSRKETLIFSFMEKYGVVAPPQVMWAVDDDIREMIKEIQAYIQEERAVYNILLEQWEKLKTEIEEMIFKEEEIMTPMILDIFTLNDWEQIARDSEEIGYAFITTPLPWKPSAAALEKEQENEPLRLAAIKTVQETTQGIAEGLKDEHTSANSTQMRLPSKETVTNQMPIEFPTGVLGFPELIAIFQTLPVDLTFVDAEETVRFYSESEARVFPRTNSVLGRKVVNCHPPKSMHMVQKILDDFKTGTKKTADFWIDMGPKRIYIRYFALHDQTNQYLGCLEVTQDITEIQQLKGQKRLLD